MDTELLLKIFSRPDAYYQWDNYIKYANRCTSESISIKKDWVNALEFMKNELGPGFFKICDKNHPLLPLLQAKGGWQTERLIEITKLLNILKESDQGYEKLRQKLIPSALCITEGKPFLDVLLMTYASGLSSPLGARSRAV